MAEPPRILFQKVEVLLVPHGNESLSYDRAARPSPGPSRRRLNCPDIGAKFVRAIYRYAAVVGGRGTHKATARHGAGTIDGRGKKNLPEKIQEGFDVGKFREKATQAVSGLRISPILRLRPQEAEAGTGRGKWREAEIDAKQRHGAARNKYF